LSQGYICSALNSGDANYLQMAYCLAISLKLTQSTVSRLSVVVDRAADVPAVYRQVFDHVIELPVDHSAPNGWRVQNYHQLYVLSPYDETVTLDADMLFFKDVSKWWDVMRRKEIVAATRVLDYRGNLVTHNPYRENFYRCGLPDVHNGFLFFRKSPLTERLFQTMREFTLEWETACTRYFGQPEIYSGDASLALALRHLQLEEVCQTHDTGGIPVFIHMKTGMQGWSGAVDGDWRKYASIEWSDRLDLKIEGYDIRFPLHYHLRDFLSPELLLRYEEALQHQLRCPAP